MKQRAIGRARGVQLCSVADDERLGITIAGETFVPDAATAYVEFFLSHAFPVYLDVPNPGEEPARTAIHPATIANSYRSLRGKVLNLGHLMRAYDPKNNPRDRIFGTVMAVELSGPAGPLETPSDGWKVQGDPNLAPGIRAVAAMHKNAEGVGQALEGWEQGKTPFSDTQWTVSMENEAYLEDGGFLIKSSPDRPFSVPDGPSWWEKTPEDFRALGWTYVPWADAPKPLRKTLKDGGEIALAVDNYEGHELLFLNGGLNGKLFYYGVALTPVGKESRARVRRMVASATAKVMANESADSATVAVATACDAIAEFCEKIYDAKWESTSTQPRLR